MLIPNLLSSSGVQGLFNSANFYLPFYDSGAGAVSLVEQSQNATPTFTRATVAWTKLSTGLWAQVASGTARSCYIGATTAASAYGGYFTEGAATQLVTPDANIRDMTGVGWAAVTMTVAKTATGIDGVVNSATTLTATGAGATVLHLLVAAASDRTYSAWIRRVTGTGTVKLVQGATKSADFAGSINTSTYTRVELDASVDVTLLGYGIELGTSGDVIEVDFNQFEAGAFATSPMATAGAARNGDVLTYPFSGNASSSVGTAYMELMNETSGAATVNLTALWFGANQYQLLIFNGSAMTTTGQFNTATINIKTGLSNISTAVRKRACSWGGTGLSVTGDGLAVVTAAFDGNFGSTNISIGNAANAEQWYGTIKNTRIWQSQFPDATLQALTA